MKTIAEILNVRKLPLRIRDHRGKEIYFEYPLGTWCKMQYDDDGNMTHCSKSDGTWYSREYDSFNNAVYHKHSDGSWWKKGFNRRGDQLFYESSDGTWWKKQFDSMGRLIDHRTSNDANNQHGCPCCSSGTNLSVDPR